MVLRIKFLPARATRHASKKGHFLGPVRNKLDFLLHLRETGSITI